MLVALSRLEYPAHRCICVNVDSGQHLPRNAGDDRTNLFCRCLDSRWMLPLLRNSCRAGPYKHPGTTGSPRIRSVPSLDYGATRHRPEKFLNLRIAATLFGRGSSASFSRVHLLRLTVKGHAPDRTSHRETGVAVREVLAFRTVRAIFARYPG